MTRKLTLALIFLLAACTNSTSQALPVPTKYTIPDQPTTTGAFDPTATQSQTVRTATPRPQSPPAPISYGPDEFPAGYNPLTGQPVSDPARLEYPAILLSVSHFPPEARPQSGFSFMPFVYEYYITEGSTRHLGVVYGELPEPEIPLYGDCDVRAEPLTQTEMVLGNRVWHDKNGNGRQDPREGGIGGICVNLLDKNGTRLEQTTTDSNGYYGFHMEGGRYLLEVKRPRWLEFTEENEGDERSDSDIDPASGRTEVIDISGSSLYLGDAGLVPSSDLTPDPEATLPRAEVGPIRSGRIFYRFMGAMYQDSCLIYAGADPDVQEHIPRCATVAHTDVGGGAMLALERMARIAEQIKKANPNFNYTGHLFSDQPPPGGEPVRELQEYWALLNQSKWTYDAASESWWRYVDEADREAPGVLHANIDRLTGRQLQFENVILMFAEHIVITPTIIDINLAIGQQRDAYLFRDGTMHKIKWSTVATEYQKKTGRGQPMRFLDLDGSPAALKPGKTWVIIHSLDSYLQDLGSGVFRARFVPPWGAKVE
jgi:hypothetical protein